MTAMILYFDHLMSVIIAAVVTLMLVTFQSSVQETTVGRTLLYSGKKATLELADILERDLANAGHQAPPGQTGIIVHTPATLSGVDVTQTIEFWTDIAGAQGRVRYQLAGVDSVELEGTMVPLFQLSRSENFGAGWIPGGGSGPVLTGFRIDLRTDNNQPAADLSAVRALRVRVATAIAPGVHRSGFLSGMRILRWGAVLRPPRLQNFSGE